LEVWAQAQTKLPHRAETLFELTLAHLAADRLSVAAETGERLAVCST
jgi:hypothetical protein